MSPQNNLKRPKFYVEQWNAALLLFFWACHRAWRTTGKLSLIYASGQKEAYSAIIYLKRFLVDPMVPPFVEMIGQCLSEGSMQIVPKVSVFDLTTMVMYVRARVARLLASARVKISWRQRQRRRGFNETELQ